LTAPRHHAALAAQTPFSRFQHAVNQKSPGNQQVSAEGY